MQDEEVRHKYDYIKDCLEWEKLHGRHKYLINSVNSPKVPNWLKSKGGKE